jgi:hypothetical protein
VQRLPRYFSSGKKKLINNRKLTPFIFISGNPERVAVPLNGPGGRIAILELKKGGRLPDGPLAAYFNTCKVLDFAWDPFNNHRLAVGMATDHYFFFND